jgi:hypothetical protein
LHLGVAVGVLEPSSEQLPPGTDRSAVRPVTVTAVRDWTRLGFPAQDERLRRAWIDQEAWIEGREREEIEVWGADWRSFRGRLLDAVARLDPADWFLVEDLSARLAEQDPAMIGNAFTAASSRATRGDGDERVSAIAQVIEIELDTALRWLGIVQTGVAPRLGQAVRHLEPPHAEEHGSVPVLEVSPGGLVTLHRAAPVHVWSLSAFADAETLLPQATYQLRPGSVSRALGAGFGLEQIVAYLEAQGNATIPAEVLEHLRDWTVGYRRVRLQRALVLKPDNPEAADDLRALLEDAGATVLPALTADGAVVAILSATPDSQAGSEDAVQALLRANGFAGQWPRPQGPRPSRRG